MKLLSKIQDKIENKVIKIAHRLIVIENKFNFISIIKI